MAAPPTLTEQSGVSREGHSPSGLLRVRSAAEVVKLESGEINAEAFPEENLPALTGYINEAWRRNVENKQVIEDRIMDAMRRRRGEYPPEKLAQIKSAGGTQLFMKLTELKCNAAEAWIMDVLSPADDKPWTMGPTPVADLPPALTASIVQEVMVQLVDEINRHGETMSLAEVRALASSLRDRAMGEVQSEARTRADRMETVIDDQFTEAKWELAFRECITDLVTTGTGIMRGPFVRNQKVLAWSSNNQAMVKTDVNIGFARVDPMDFFPAPGARDVDDGDCLERILYEANELFGLKGLEGYDDGAISAALELYYAGGFYIPMRYDTARQHLAIELPTTFIRAGKIECHRFTGRVPGKLLIEWGMKGYPLESDRQYDIIADQIGNFTIRAVINFHPLGWRQYSKAVFRPIPGSFWGEGVPELMSDVQDICNASARSLINNMAMASGPQVGIHAANRLVEGQSLTGLYPWRIWQFHNREQDGSDPIKFHNVDSHAGELMGIFNEFAPQADDRTGVPAYSYGSDTTAGAGRTATGLSMLMTSAARGIKLAIIAIDQGIIERQVEMCYVHNMLYHARDDIKGDLRVEARGAIGLFLREQKTLRLQEFTGMIRDDQTALQVMGPARYIELLRQNAKVLDIPTDEIFPSKEEVQFAYPETPETPGGPGPADASGMLPPGQPGAESVPGLPGAAQAPAAPPAELTEQELMLA